MDEDDNPPASPAGRHVYYDDDDGCDGCTCCTHVACPGACEWEHCPCRADS